MKKLGGDKNTSYTGATQSDQRRGSINRTHLRAGDEWLEFDSAQELLIPRYDLEGAVVEQGTDANGPYLLFASGAKIAYDSGGVLQLTL